MPTVEIGGIETSYRDLGSGQPVVFIHGATGENGVWRFQMEALSDQYRLIGYDLRDHGQTDSSSEPYTTERLATDLHALIDTLDLSDPVVCGFSLGGYVAQRHALSYPGEASGYAFVGTTTPDVVSPGEYAVELGGTRLLETTAGLAGEQSVRQPLEQLKPLLTRGDETGETHRHQSENGRLERITQLIRHWKQESIVLSRIPVPVLVVYGEYDRPAVKIHAERMQAEIDRVSHRAVPDAGHFAHLDRPDVFTAFLRRFLERFQSP